MTARMIRMTLTALRAVGMGGLGAGGYTGRFLVVGITDDPRALPVIRLPGATDGSPEGTVPPLGRSAGPRSAPSPGFRALHPHHEE
ncbi:hypothetical protein GCM10009551_050480 [Nocardiopsis tropica]